MFQKVWSGRVVNEGTAWELIALVDQIHLWAIGEFRTFVLEHLRPWHAFCDENYLLDWDSVYDTVPERKRKRDLSEDSDLPLPSWASLLNKSAQSNIQAQARESLAQAIKERQLSKGKAKCSDDSDSDNASNWECRLDTCHPDRPRFESGEAYLHHIRSVHALSKWEVLSMRRLVEQTDKEDQGLHHSAPTTHNGPGPSQKRAKAQ